jgi:hypothetical protein
MNVEEVLSKVVKLQQEHLSQYQDQFKHQDEFIHIKNFFPREFVDTYLIPGVDKTKPLINRSYIPMTKQGGSVSSHLLSVNAPNFHKLYKYEPFMRYLQSLITISVRQRFTTVSHFVGILSLP